MKPLPPIRPTEKLPVVINLSIVEDPSEKGSWSVVASEMRGDNVIRRRVLDTVHHIDFALDSLNKTAYRLWYFNEPLEEMG